VCEQVLREEWNRQGDLATAWLVDVPAGDQRPACDRETLPGSRGPWLIVGVEGNRDRIDKRLVIGLVLARGDDYGLSTGLGNELGGSNVGNPDLYPHGDLHLRQVLVSETGRLSGVLDWVDICVAPASVDLAPYWSLFSPKDRGDFLRAYGPVDPDTLLRARVLALCLSAMLAAYAIDREDKLLLAETLAELDRELVD
jgi:hypothetical protein